MRIIVLSLLVALCMPMKAQKTFVERSTDVLSVTPTLAALTVSIVENDTKGMAELGLSTAATLVANYALEASIKKSRPDGTGNHSFPSTHTALAFDGASYLMKRYGWKWGIPAYSVSTYVAWGRVYADKHDVWDVLGGAALGTAAALVFTHSRNSGVLLSVSPCVMGNSAKGLHASITF